MKDLLLIFSSGIIGGAVLEFLYRSLSAGKIVYPRLANYFLYGLVATALYSVAALDGSWYIRLVLIVLVPTIAELIYGALFVRFTKIRLWDYSEQMLNYRGLICLEFSMYWAILSVVYVYIVIPVIIKIKL